MKTSEFEIELKKIDAHLHLVESPQAPDMLGIYYTEDNKKEHYITGIPNGEIYAETRPEYQNPFGTPHKTSEVATAQVNAWLLEKDDNIKLDNDFNKLMVKK